MIKVAIIGTVGVPANYGGYETLVENLLIYKNDPQIEYIVYCSSRAYQDKLKEYKGAKLKYVPFNANGWQAVIYDTVSMLNAYFTADVILSLGTVGCFILPIMKIFSGKKVIVNLDGLDNKREKWNIFSKIIIGGARWCAAKFADVRVSDNQGIKEYVRDVYGKDSVLIEYGGDNASSVIDEELLRSLYGLTPRGYSFKVARIEPENNIEMILKAFSQMPHEKLVLVGNWNKNEFGRRMRQVYKHFDNIKMQDAEYDSQKLNLMRSNCKLYIHGHSAGGTNPSLVEAMYLGLPIAAFDVTYNRYTTENRALYFSSAEELKGVLESTNESLDRVSEQMSDIANCRYLWSIISDKYENILK